MGHTCRFDSLKEENLGILNICLFALLFLAEKIDFCQKMLFSSISEGPHIYISTNICVYTTQSRIGNWSVEVGGSALSWPRGSGLHVQVRLDRKDKIWLNGTIEGRCLHTAAGYMNGKYRIISAIFAKIPKEY